jgi:hypothetical protein
MVAAPERTARLAAAIRANPNAMLHALIGIRAQIVEAAAANKRGFVYASYRDGRLVSSELRLGFLCTAAHLRVCVWVCLLVAPNIAVALAVPTVCAVVRAERE